MERAAIKFIQSLSQKKIRDEHRLFIVEGEKLVEELLHTNFIIQKIVYTKKVSFATPPQISEQVSEAVMERLSAFKTPPTILAVVENPHEQRLPKLSNDELYLALDNIQDPGNLGTIMRIADWFGIRHIFCSLDTVDCFNSKVVQATMGAIFRTRVHYIDLAKFLQETEKTIPIYGTFLDGENIYQQTLTKGGIIVMGNEGKGISPEVAATVSSRLFIPSYLGQQSSESLNVAASTAILCAEFRRRIGN